MPVVFAFVFYAFLDIIKSSVFVPAKMGKEMAAAYIMMLAGTIAFFLGTRTYFNPMISMSYAMCFGTGVALLMSLCMCKVKIGEWLFHHEHFILIAQALVITLASHIENLPLKIASFIVFTALYVWAVNISNLVDLKNLWKKYLKKSF
jgi:hypothetical protein